LVVNWAPLRQSAQALRDRATAFESAADAALAGGGSWPGGTALAANAKLISAERAFLGDGLQGRTWFRHELYAPGLNTGYAPVPLPGIGQAIMDKSQPALAHGATAVKAALDRAAALFGP